MRDSKVRAKARTDQVRRGSRFVAPFSVSSHRVRRPVAVSVAVLASRDCIGRLLA